MAYGVKSRAGDRDKWVEVLLPREETLSSNEPHMVYDVLTGTYAKYRELNGREIEYYSTAAVRVQCMFTILYDEHIDETCRIRFRGRDFAIERAVNIDEQDAELDLLCSLIQTDKALPHES